MTRPVGQAVKTLASHAGNMGSIPVRVTKTQKKHCVAMLFLILTISSNESEPRKAARLCIASEQRLTVTFPFRASRGSDSRTGHQKRKKHCSRSAFSVSDELVVIGMACEARMGSVSPLGDRGACSPGGESAKFAPKIFAQRNSRVAAMLFRQANLNPAKSQDFA